MCGFNTFAGRNKFFYFSQSFSFEKLENEIFEHICGYYTYKSFLNFSVLAIWKSLKRCPKKIFGYFPEHIKFFCFSHMKELEKISK